MKDQNLLVPFRYTVGILFTGYVHSVCLVIYLPSFTQLYICQFWRSQESIAEESSLPKCEAKSFGWAATGVSKKQFAFIFRFEGPCRISEFSTPQLCKPQNNAQDV